MVRTSPSKARGVNSIPGRGGKGSHALWPKNPDKPKEEKQYCDKGNYSHMAQILTSIAMYEVLQQHGKGARAYEQI